MVNLDLNNKLRFIRKAFGNYEMGRDGRNVAVACPSQQCRDSRKKKLAIRLDDDRVNCWVCHLKGRVLSIIKKFRPSLVHEYVQQFGGTIEIFRDEERPKACMPEGFRMIAAYPDSRDPAIRLARNYVVKSRGLSERDMWYFKLGVSTDKSLRRRVVMLSFDAVGELNFYSARAVDPDAFRKYMNADAEKKAIVFNELGIDWSKELTITEGPFDLVKCDENSTCLLGCSLSEDSLLFGRIYQNKTPIVLALDKDMENREWQRIARMLDSYDIPVRIMDMGQHKDVGEMTKEQFLEAKGRATVWDREAALRKKIQSLPV